MSRGLSSLNLAEANARVVRPVYFCRINFESGDVLVCSAPMNFVFDWDEDEEVTDDIFLGIGAFGGLSNIEEGSELQTYGVNISLSGIPSEYLAMVTGEHYQGRDCRIWKGYCDTGHVLVDTPVLAFRGRLNNAEVDLIKRSISIVVESRLVDWERPRIGRYNNEDQQARYPDDRGLEYVAQMVEKNLVWGSS